MQIKIKSARVGKTGESVKGKWKLIIVTSEDGTDYTTFDKSAEFLSPGTVIEFEPIIKGDKTNFTKYTVISKPSKPAAPSTSKDDRIAEQVAIKEIGECWRAGKFKDNDPLTTAYLAWLMIHVGDDDTKEAPDLGLYLPEKDETLPEKGETPIDMDWLFDSLQKLGTSDTAFRSAVGGSYRVDTTGSWNDMIGRLTVEQQKGLVRRIEAALEKKTTKEE